MLTIGSKIVFMSDLVKRYNVVAVFTNLWPAILVTGRRPDISVRAMCVENAQLIYGKWCEAIGGCYFLIFELGR